ncbi:MAG TPA: YbaB/EbfC family nucleoid-associated protein [bacterium]|nr:YbaB/EbfC family nucleoid-associated protein [bacterium]HPO08540.1 YbaB/EbfC family nucleoid-associated protein [bacterium]HQQ00308.1 YbaB/EbfC family nucleoid-associated protein [bacterium]
MKGLGNLANLGQMLKQAQQMQGHIAELQEELANTKATGSAGGGLVTVTMNGQFQVTEVKIDPEVVDPGDLGLLEDLLLVAFNEAAGRTQEHAKKRMTEITGGIQIPGMLGG